MEIRTKVLIENLIGFYYQFGGILKCSIIIEPYVIGLDKWFQGWRDQADMQKRLTQLCWGMFGPSVTGQYTLRERCQRTLAGRIDIFYRVANQREAELDFRELGDQVMGARLTGGPSEDCHATMTFLGEKFRHQGPMRFENVFCPIISFEGPLPEKAEAAALIKEIDACLLDREIIPGEEKKTAAYFFLCADHGRMLLAPFHDLQTYSRDGGIFIGHMAMQEEELIFFPEGDLTSPIPYTDHLFKD